MINDVPTVFEVVTGNAMPPKDQSGAQNNGSKNKSSGKMVRQCNHAFYKHFYSGCFLPQRVKVSFFFLVVRFALNSLSRKE